MRIFVINLERNFERRKSIEAILGAFNLDFEFCPGVDGSKLSDEELSKVQTVDKLYLDTAGGRQIIVNNKLSNGEIGCALAHLKLYQHILDLGLDRTCILEDDCVVNQHFVEALQAIDNIKEPWDIVNFTDYRGFKSWFFAKKYHFGADPEVAKTQYFQRIGLWHPTLDAIFNARRFLSMTACYFVSRQACEKMIKIGYPVRMAADHLTGLLAYNHFRLFKVYPDNFYYVKYSDFESDIRKNSTHLPEHRIERV